MYGGSYNNRDENRGGYGGGNSYGGGYGGFGGNSGGGKGKGGGKGSLGAGLNMNINWASQNIVDVVKNFYQEQPAIQNMSQEEVALWRKEHEISIVRGDAPKPLRTFEEAGFPMEIMQSIQQAGFEKPSPIQSQGWPVALSGHDMIGIAETGSGKTCSFLLPGFVHLQAQPSLQRGDGPIVLVLAPTRELVQQIQVECEKFGRNSRIRSTSLVGGMPKGPQIRDMRAGREVVVATPGRLIDLLEMGIFNLKRTTYLCLDEADRMLDMGFEKPIRQICSQIRCERQTLLWSATWPREVQNLARELCANAPVHIRIGSDGLKTNHRVTQHIEVIDHWSKEDRMMKVIDEETQKNPQGKVIIFTKTKKDCDKLGYRLNRHGASWIHGDKTQWERDQALEKFRNGRNKILVATDVAARGLDVKDVTLVINYDMPMNIEDYVHRIGRTARAGAYGTAYTFFVKNDLQNAGKMARELIKMLTEAKQQVPPTLYEVSQEYGGGKGKGRFGGGKGKGRGKGGFGGGGGGFSRSTPYGGSRY